MAARRLFHRPHVALLVMPWLFASATVIAAAIVAVAAPAACPPPAPPPEPLERRICVQAPEYSDEFGAMLSQQIRAGLVHTPAGDALLDYLELRARLARLCESA